MSDSMDHDAREVIRRRIELRERDGHERLLLNHDALRALLDAADERDRLAAQVERHTDAVHAHEWREVPGVLEHGDKPCLIGASHPASEPCEYPCPATMPGHRCTRLEHVNGGHLWKMTDAEWDRLVAETAHAHLPITEDADGLTCDICGAELADWAAADAHVETHEGWAG